MKTTHVDMEFLLGSTIKYMGDKLPDNVTIDREWESGAYDSYAMYYILLDHNRAAVFTHDQDCCEEVWLEDVCGDASGMIGERIMRAYYTIQKPSDSDGIDYELHGDNGLTHWTFYHVGTFSDGVTLRFMGASNGYYATEVNVHFAEWEHKQ